MSPDAADWAFRVSTQNGSETAGITGYRLATLLEKVGIDRVSLLKMDIEGAELEVMSDSDSWIGHVDNIVLEIHESLRPGCTVVFNDHTKGFHTLGRTKELTLVSRRPPVER